MVITDSQVHMWGAATPGRPWPPDRTRQAQKPYPFRVLHEPLHRIFGAFGPERTFWGTDWTRLPCSYRQAVTMFTEELPWLKGADLEGVMGRGLSAWLGRPQGT